MTSRRSLLKLSAAFCGSLGLASASRWAHAFLATPAPISAALAHAVTNALTAPDCACVVGRAAVATGACGSGLGDLTRALLSILELDAQSLATTPAPALRALLGANCRADFAAGRTVLVDGWLLSRTEVTVSGIAHLYADGST